MADPQLGDTVRDSVSNCVGIVNGICTYLHGGTRVQVQPVVQGEADTHKARPESWWADPDALTVTQAASPPQ